MPVPDFQTAMLPVLRDFARGERSSADTLAALSTHFALTPDELAQRLPSGKQTTFANRMAYLSRFPEYVAFRRGENSGGEVGPGVVPTARPPANVPAPVGVEARTPDELIDEGYRQLRRALVNDIRERMADMAPGAFEQLVVDVLRAMGYGGPEDDSAHVVGGSGDEGIDGVIREDRLGLEMIYLQAKRWQSVVGRPEIQRFAGALQGQRARKGVFITTSAFTKEAEAYARSIQTTIVLVDGAQPAELMIDHGVGVTTYKAYELKRLDSDYFAAE